MTSVAFALALGGLAGALLLPDDEPIAPTTTPTATRPTRSEPQAPADKAPAPAVEAPPAAPDPIVSPADLGPLATTWREAIVHLQRDAIAQGVGALRSAPDGRVQLVRLASDAHPRVRAFALRELGRWRDPSLAPVFQGSLADESPYVRENAEWALGLLAARPVEPVEPVERPVGRPVGRPVEEAR